MSQLSPRAVVGNEFVLPSPSLQLAAPAIVDDPAVTMTINPVLMPHQEVIPVAVKPVSSRRFGHLFDLLYQHSFVVFSLLFLLVGATSIQVGGRYYAAYLASQIKPVSSLSLKKHSIIGLNLAVPTSQLQQTIQKITDQTANLSIGSQAAPISPDTIKNWLRVTSDSTKTEQYISVKTDAISQSLTELANKFTVTPINQVSVIHNGVAQIVVAGRNGVKLGDPSTLATQAHTIAKTVMDAKGMQFSTPLVTEPFQAVTAAAFSKLIEVDVVTKQMYLYDNGQLTRSYPISAGAPATPTPIGEFHIYAKLPVQDMSGYNADGTKYLQPHVHWINYFSGGNAVHGNYWRPLSWFGVINSSHGCVSLPDDQAEWVYNWAPLGTTVITHY